MFLESTWDMRAVDMCHCSSPTVPRSLGTIRGMALKGRGVGQADPAAGVHVLPEQSWWQSCPGTAEHIQDIGAGGLV